MASSVKVQDFRGFMFQEISQHLTPSDVEHLVYTQNLPIPDLTESSIKVLMKLEMRDRFSASNLKPLADMLKKVNRDDLAKKVDKFQKSQKKKDYKKKDSSTGDSHAMYQQCEVIASIQTTKLQAKILLEQTEELESTARKFGHTEVAKVIKEAIAIFEDQFQEKLRQASSKVPQLKQERRDSSDSSSSGTSSNEGTVTEQANQQTEIDSKDHEYENVPYGDTSSPLVETLDVTEQNNQQTEVNLKDHEYEEVAYGDSSSSPVEILESCLSTSAPQSIQDTSKGVMVTGKDGPGQSKQKPAVPPKPAKLQRNWTDFSHSTDYTGGSADTSTGDSGFVDAAKFRKDYPPLPLPQHRYEPLKADQREEVSSYATPLPRDV